MPSTIDQFISNYPTEVQTKDPGGDSKVRAGGGGGDGVWDSHLQTQWQEPSAFLGVQGTYRLLPTPTGIEKFKKELSAYEGAKGSVKFPLNKPIPYALIGKITQFRVKEVEGQVAPKVKKKT